MTLARCRFLILSWSLLTLVPAAYGQVFETVGVHPEASQQSTAIGQTLHTLHAVGSRIFLGYGDWSADTGPITLRAFDAVQGAFEPPLIVGNTESIARFATIGNSVVAPLIDPRGFSPGGYLQGPAAGAGTWSQLSTLAGLHFFDLAASDDQHWLLVGSGGPTAITHSIVYQTNDGGATWTLALDLPVPASETNPNAFTRFYGAGLLGGKFFVQQVLFNSSSVPGGNKPLSVYSYDGTQWIDLGDLRTSAGVATQFIDPDAFAGRILLRDRQSGQSASPMFTFDGIQLSPLSLPGPNNPLAWDHWVASDGLYVLTTEQEIQFTPDLVTWSRITDHVPAQARSLTVTPGAIWLGGTDSNLYRMELVPEPGGMLLLLCGTLCLIGRRRFCRH